MTRVSTTYWMPARASTKVSWVHTGHFYSVAPLPAWTLGDVLWCQLRCSYSHLFFKHCGWNAIVTGIGDNIRGFCLCLGSQCHLVSYWHQNPVGSLTHLPPAFWLLFHNTLSHPAKIFFSVTGIWPPKCGIGLEALLLGLHSSWIEVWVKDIAWHINKQRMFWSSSHQPLQPPPTVYHEGIQDGEK